MNSAHFFPVHLSGSLSVVARTKSGRRRTAKCFAIYRSRARHFGSGETTPETDRVPTCFHSSRTALDALSRGNRTHKSSPFVRLRRRLQIASERRRVNTVRFVIMARRADPDYTEFGIKIHKLRLTLKVQKRASSATPVQQNHHQAVIADAQTRQRRGRSIGDQRVRQQVQQQPASERRPQSRGRHRGRPRTGSSVSSSGASIADSLRLLDLDANAGSRRPVVQDNGNIPSNSGTRVANWEFQVGKANLFK